MPDVNGPHNLGYPCWVDLMTPDIDRAAAFYAKILDWQYQVTGPEFGNYHLAHLDERSVAGMGPIQNGMPPVWSLYFATDDVNAMTAEAEKLGATILSAPMEVPGQGRMAIIMDPTGAAFGLWESKGHTGFGVTGVSGTLAWSEVNTRDVEAAKTFYTKLLGAQAEPMDAGGTVYYMLKKDGMPISGILQMDETWAGIQPHWMLYFQVSDVDAATATVTSNGGSVSRDPFDTPFGRVAVVSDPAKVPFSLIQMAGAS